MNDGLPEAESALRARILAIHQEDKKVGAVCIASSGATVWT